MQCSIDNSKRVYAVNINDEIKRIKELIDVENNKYPEFWFGLQRKNKFSKSIMAHSMAAEAQKLKNESKINHDLICPMNFLFNYQFSRNSFRTRTIPMSNFFNKTPIDGNKRRSKKAEQLIIKYLQAKNAEEDRCGDCKMLEDDYNELIKDLRATYIREDDSGIIAALLDRAFLITPQMKNYTGSALVNQKQDLFNILFASSPKAFLRCFSK